MFEVSPSTSLLPMWKSSRANGRTNCINLSTASWIKAPGKQQTSLDEGSDWQMRFSVPRSRDLLPTITCSFLVLLHSLRSTSTGASSSDLFHLMNTLELLNFLVKNVFALRLLLAGCIHFSYCHTTATKEACPCWIVNSMEQGGPSLAAALWGLRHLFVHRCSVAMAVLYIRDCAVGCFE